MDKVDYTEIAKRCLVLGWLFLFATVALKLFGFSAFGIDAVSPDAPICRVDAFINSSPVMVFLFSVLSTVVGVNLLYACVVDNYRKHVAKYMLISTITAISAIYCRENSYVFGMCIISFLLYFIPHKEVNKIRYVFYIILADALFSAMTIYSTQASTYYQNNGTTSILFSSLDYYTILVLHLILIRKGDLLLFSGEHGQAYLISLLKHLKTNLKSTVLRLKLQKPTPSAQQFKNALTSSMLTLKLYVKIELASDLKSKVLPHLVVFSFYFGYAHLLGRVFESVFLYVAYLSIRKLFPKHFHADYIPGINADLIGVTCICLSTTTLCAALFQTTAISFSIFNTIFVAAFVDFALYCARDLLDLRKRYETDFTKYGLSPMLAQIAYDWKVVGLSTKEQSDKSGYSTETIKRYRNRINKAINR